MSATLPSTATESRRAQVIRYRLRHPAQVAFAATRPGAMTRSVESDQVKRSEP